MRRALTVPICLIASTPAAAEVCDKVRPAWKPQDGSIGQFEDLALFLLEPMGLIAVGLTVAAVLLKKTWLSVTAIVILLLDIALNVSTWREADDVTGFAIAEGCLTAPILTTVALIALATIIATQTWIGSRNGPTSR